MPNVTFGAILSHIMEYQVNGQRCLLTQHYRLRLPASGPVDGVAVANAVDVEDKSGFNFDLTFSNVLSENVDIVQRRLQWIYPTRYVTYTYTPPITTGSVEALPYPPAVASAVTMRPGVAIRGRIGTKHLGGVPTTFVEAGILTEDAVTAYEALAEDMRSPYVLTVGGSPVELEPILLKRGAEQDSLLIESYSVQTTSRTERRRVVGRGI